MEEVREVLSSFGVPLKNVELQTLNQGLINQTIAVLEGGRKKYVLQRINQEVFPDTGALERNLERVLPVLHAEDYSRLEFLRTRAGDLFFRSPDKQVWRLMRYVPDSLAHHFTSNKKVATEAGRVIGVFHRLVAHLDPADLSVPLDRFHDLSWRAYQYETALTAASQKDLARTGNMRDFVEEGLLGLRPFQQAELPLRVCHNDSKLNNILFSRDGTAMCLIDLDTLMPGHFAYDFGDAARTIANPAPEEETDLSRIQFSIAMFDSFVKGLSLNKQILEEEEIATLPLSVVYMPFLHGLRAYTDFLQGNLYYKVAYPDQNLDRARGLFHFSRLALENQEVIREVILARLS